MSGSMRRHPSEVIEQIFRECGRNVDSAFRARLEEIDRRSRGTAPELQHRYWAMLEQVILEETPLGSSSLYHRHLRAIYYGYSLPEDTEG